MVQRKVPGKLGIEADRPSHDRQNRLITVLKKPFSSQHQDGKTRGPEVKKKMMKKSRSFKLSDIGQQSLKACSDPSSAIRRNTISQPGKPPPNLSVPTTSPKALQTPKKLSPTLESSPNYMKPTSCFERKAIFPTTAKLGSASSSGKKAAKSSGSKLGVRALAMAPSFKPVRKSEHVEVRRATCSSTLKDSKFPNYLELDHGGTEAEGTSVMKVCPYTYCSLNGHHHKRASLPPLKRFLSAKRRALRTQKSDDLDQLSKGVRDFDEEEAVERVGMSFFIEVYAETLKKAEEIVVESVSDGSPQSEIDAEEALERCSEEKMGLVEAGFEERDFVCRSSDEEETEGSYSCGSGSDMEWEEGEFSEEGIENGAENSREIDDESQSNFGWSLEIENCTSDVLEDDGLSNCDVCMNQEFEEESACFGGELAEEESEKVDDSLFGEQLSCNEDCEDLNGVEEMDEIFEEPNVSEKTVESSDTDKQVDETFDLNLVSRHVLEEIAISDLTEIKEEADGEADTNVEEIADKEIADSKPNGSEIKEDDKEESENNREQKKKQPFSRVDQEIAEEELRNKWSIGKRQIKDSDEEMDKNFNPKEPNYLPLVADPEGEKVDLKHQEIDERKNSEDWMIDHALQQAVTKLGPARKRRVALLVEAFETVSPNPIPKFEARQHHYRHHPSSPVFSHAIRPIQACN